MSYFVITVEDGQVRIDSVTSDAAVLELLDFDEETGKLLSEPFATSESIDLDPGYWKKNQVLIVKGEVVTPKPVAVRYELP